ncbi:putative bifunctional diguanylate cyclase/phosphodiesterase [Actinotalea lenta]|uniref:putative bifunctional diguanylate cyclase/phosphodiesterase n=1 Tax=Actinotalea lenta TaxID=3064654 RepID=UPI00272A281A|nr:EAL domain-containing protein [Isoptericola sp. b490]
MAKQTGGLTRAVRALAPVPWILIVVGGLVITQLPGGSAGAVARTGVSIMIGIFFAVVILRVLLHAATKRRRELWAGLALAGAMMMWALGSAAISQNQAHGAVPFPAPGETLNVSSYLLLAAFLLLDASRFARSLPVLLDAAVVVGGTISVTAFVFVAPVARHFDGAVLPLVVAVLFPLINLVLAGIVLGQVVVGERSRDVRSWMLVGGFLALAAGDSSFLMDVRPVSAYGTNIGIAAVWGVGFALLGEAAVRPVVAEVRARTSGHASGPQVVASALAVAALALSPEGLAGWLVRGAALLTLTATMWRLLLALREARGAAEAMRLSLTDELTGLPNRRSMLASTDHAIQHRGPVSVLLLDLDAFKDINDSLGHAVGDLVLIDFAERLRDAVDPGSSVARLGGDEFAVLVPSEDEIELFETAQRVRAALRRPLRVEGIDISLDASVGIAVREDTDTSAIEMLRRADVAMYEAKNADAGVLVFDRAQDGMSHLRLLRGEALRAAIAEGELVAWYQPQVDARTRQVVAVEALVRWWHPTEGLLPPIAFLTDARRAGLMPALTESVMLQVVADASRWRAAGFTFRVAMNWAPPELVNGQLLPRLFSAIEEAHLPPESLLVEVTEDSFLTDPERARMVLHEIRSHGVQVSIDDYGSGFSSLAYLRDLPVQELKMDRAFVAPVASDERSRMIVQTTTQMARALGLRFVAEGVEDAVALSELVPLGVDVVQGYHIARPMPADAVGPWVRQWTESHLSSRLA